MIQLPKQDSDDTESSDDSKYHTGEPQEYWDFINAQDDGDNS